MDGAQTQWDSFISACLQEQKPGLKDKTYFECDMWKIGTRRVTYCIGGTCFLLVFSTTQIISCVDSVVL